MALIDIGAEAKDRPSLEAGNTTHIALDNPANLTGKITSIELWFGGVFDATDVRVGTFYGTAPNFTCRDYAVIGDVARGSKQTFTKDSEETPLAIAVEAGDYIGIFNNVGQLESTTVIGLGIYYKVGDQTETGEQTYGLYAGVIISVYGEGATPVAMAGSPVVSAVIALDLI